MPLLPSGRMVEPAEIAATVAYLCLGGGRPR